MCIRELRGCKLYFSHVSPCYKQHVLCNKIPSAHSAQYNDCHPKHRRHAAQEARPHRRRQLKREGLEQLWVYELEYERGRSSREVSFYVLYSPLSTRGSRILSVR